MTTLYTYSLTTGEHTGEREAQMRPNGEPILDAIGATPTAPPADVPSGHAARWTGTAWEVVEDHRQHMDKRGTKQGGTAYWLPSEGDDWRSPERYTEDMGPLPEGAVTERPARPAAELLAEAVAAKRREILAGYDAAMTATLTMPNADPGAAEVALAALDFAADDAEGLADVRVILADRRDELLAALDAAATAQAAQAIAVTYPV